VIDSHAAEKWKEGQEKSPNPPHGIKLAFKLLLRRFGAIGRAATLTLAGVLAFAAVVAGFAAALALAGVLPFTSVLFFDFLIVLLVPLVLSAE
jgi:hypothetical protein